jgi:hypothetical protein
MVKKYKTFRIQPSLLKEARKVAESEGVALNQLINVALAEKLSALRTAEHFRERIRRADRTETLRILGRSGKGKPPMDGDILPDDLFFDRKRARKTNRAPGKSTNQIGKMNRRIEKAGTR